MKKVYIILKLTVDNAIIHMVTTNKAKALVEVLALDSFDYELREELLED